MTRLTKPVTRMVASGARTQSVPVDMKVTLTFDGIVFSGKGKRTKYLLPYAAAFWQAARLEAQRVAREKAAARKARKAGR